VRLNTNQPTVTVSRHFLLLKRVHNFAKISRLLLKPLTYRKTPFSVWPHLFSGAGHEKRRGEQLKWSLAFRLYIGSFLCAQLPGPVHTARLGRVCFFCVFSLGLYFVCPFVLFDLFVCPHSFMFP